MSNSIVLNIPLQNTLAPSVGSYSEEGREDTTFDYDNTNEEYSLNAGNSTAQKGYYFYTPSKEVNLEEVEIDLDVKTTSASGKGWLVLFNSGETNYWGIWKYSAAEIQFNYQGTEKYISALSSISANTWTHINIKFTKEGTTTYFIVTKDSNTPSEFNIVNKDFSINNITLLGDTSTTKAPSSYSIKNIQIKTKVVDTTHIKLHVGSEVIRAYLNLADKYNSILKGNLDFKKVIDDSIAPVKTTGYNTLTIPDTTFSNKSVSLIVNSYVDDPSPYYAIAQEGDRYIYWLKAKYDSSTHLVTSVIYPNQSDYFGPTTDERSIALDIDIAITSWQNNQYVTPSYHFPVIAFSSQDPTTSTASNTLLVYCSNTGTIYNNNKSDLGNVSNTPNADPFNIELNTFYRFTVCLTFKPITKNLEIQVYINGQLRYTGVSTQRNYALSNDGSFYFTDRLGCTVLYKLSNIKVYSNLPNTWYKKLNVKKNNNTYYLLCAKSGENLSHVKAKIGNETYTVLKKEEEDTSE